jgi:hypothetical protein
MKAARSESWVLAFDAACSRCREISGVVAQACDGKLEVLPLRHPDVHRWREQAMGAQPPWAPTLLAVREGSVRAWTGPAMAVPLVRLLGVRSTVRLLRALGGLPSTRPVATSGQRLGRKRFLQLGAGLAAAAGLVLAGKTPATAAEAPECAKARAWVKANLDKLPRNYADFAAHSMAYRQAIYAELPAEIRSKLWAAHFDHYQATHAGLTTEQRKVIDQASTIVAGTGTFTAARHAGTEQRITELGESAIAAFGHAEAHAIVATLGPAEPAKAAVGPLAVCECSTWDTKWCWGVCRESSACEYTWTGCGSLWAWPCDGWCDG